MTTVRTAQGKTQQLLPAIPDRLVGVAVFSNGGFKTVLTNPFPELEAYHESAELGRFVLLDNVPANAETWFLARIFELAAQDGLRGVVSFSDPIARQAEDGTVTMPGHVGTIYQASNATYAGRATGRTLHRLPNGVFFNPQNEQKIRDQAQGHEYAEKILCSFGARPMRRREKPAAWLAQALRDARCEDVTHPGNHRYLFRLGDRRQQRNVRIGDKIAALVGPYPKPAEWNQRWREQRSSWRHTSEGGFDSNRFEVARIEPEVAKAFVIQHHYSASCTSNLFRYGLFTKETHS